MYFRKTVFFLALVIFAFTTADNAFAYMEACPSHKTKTMLHAKRAKTVFQTATIADINTSLGNAGQQFGTILAFVEYGGEDTLSINVKYQYTVIDAGNEKFCVKLDTVDAYFYAKPRIVMPKDFKKGGCEYNFILKHENRHLDTLYKFHKENTHKYALYLGQIANSLEVPHPVEGKYVETVKEQIDQYFTSKFGVLVQQSLMELQERQKKIDSPEEYHANGRRFAKCQQENKKDKDKEAGKEDTPEKIFDDPFSGFDPKKLPFGR